MAMVVGRTVTYFEPSIFHTTFRPFSFADPKFDLRMNNTAAKEQANEATEGLLNQLYTKHRKVIRNNKTFEGARPIKVSLQGPAWIKLHYKTKDTLNKWKKYWTT